ncbi:hypothetical protein [Sphingobium sp. CR28]|uniref:hypothetical protein n=1 Tax=Sphingobium sp. CR28 TaxID=3400272 RepID=UPI003FED482C
MRLASTFSMAIALALVTGSMSAAPAFAAEKKKDDVKLAPSAGFRPGAAEVDKLIKANDFANAKTKVEEVAGTATTPDDKYFLGNFYLNIGLSLKDEPMQRKGVDLMIESGKAPAAEVAKFNFYSGQFALNAKDEDTAIARFNTAIQGGYPGSSPQVLLAESYFAKAYKNVQGDQFSPAGKQLVQQGLPALKKGIELEEASGKQVPAGWYSRGFKMAALSGSPDMADWTKLALEKAPDPENWRIALRSFQDANRTMTREENLDLLRLMSASGALTNDYSIGEYLDAASKGGLIGEVKSVVDAGRASGKITGNRYADIYQLSVAGIEKDKATLPASEGSAAKAANGRIAASTGNAYLSYGNYAKAAEMYRLALTKGGVDAGEVNTRLGIALAKSGDAAGAQQAFAAVSTGGSATRKQIADLWTLWVSKPATATASAASPAA